MWLGLIQGLERLDFIFDDFELFLVVVFFDAVFAHAFVLFLLGLFELLLKSCYFPFVAGLGFEDGEPGSVRGPDHFVSISGAGLEPAWSVLAFVSLLFAQLWLFSFDVHAEHGSVLTDPLRDHDYRVVHWKNGLSFVARLGGESVLHLFVCCFHQFVLVSFGCADATGRGIQDSEYSLSSSL